MKVYVVMGVSGVGKTSIGEMLAEELKLPFYDADNFHSEKSISKMEAGIPLKDEDREDWLQSLRVKIKEWSANSGAVLACSALKEYYRKTMSSIPEEELVWIFLYSDYHVILDRISHRKDHYFRAELLRSQYEILEFPEYGIHVNVNTSKEEIIKKIMKALEKDGGTKIGLLGLGVMGKSLALNFASKETPISVYNRQTETEVDIAKNFVLENKEEDQLQGFDKLEDFIHSIEKPRSILLMVNAGKAVDAVIEDLLPLLEKDDLIIDGGNSHYKDTARRQNFLKEKGILFMGLGISGGEEGALKGPSLMPGGDKAAYDRVGRLLEKIAAKDKKGNPCCTYIGPEGAGHFVKMVHNGIEYGEMQLIAEIYHFFRFYTTAEPEEIARVFETWNEQMQSYLLEISVDILRKKEDEAPLIDLVLDAAKQKGTGGWSTNAALELGVPLDTITAAVMARNISGKKEERVEAMGSYEKKNENDKASLAGIQDKVFEAYKAGSIINHSIGFDLMREASAQYGWNLNLSQIARIWTNGCIIRSYFMEKTVGFYKEIPEKHLLLHPEIISQIKNFKPALMEIPGEALGNGFPMPCLSAAANYLQSFTSGQSSANFIQAQRDYFGAHTYERTDAPRSEFFHTIWKEKDS